MLELVDNNGTWAIEKSARIGQTRSQLGVVVESDERATVWHGLDLVSDEGGLTGLTWPIDDHDPGLTQAVPHLFDGVTGR